MKEPYNVGNKKGPKVGNTPNWLFGQKIDLFRVFKMIQRKWFLKKDSKPLILMHLLKGVGWICGFGWTR